MAALVKPLQIFGRPGWNDTKIHGIDQNLFNSDGADVDGRNPRLKKYAVERPPLSPGRLCVTRCRLTFISGLQLMYTPKWDLFASQSPNGVDAASSTISVDPVPSSISSDTVPSSVFGGYQPQPLSTHRERITHSSSVKQRVFEEPVASAESTTIEFH